MKEQGQDHKKFQRLWEVFRKTWLSDKGVINSKRAWRLRWVSVRCVAFGNILAWKPATEMSFSWARRRKNDRTRRGWGEYAAVGGGYARIGKNAG